MEWPWSDWSFYQQLLGLAAFATIAAWLTGLFRRIGKWIVCGWMRIREWWSGRSNDGHDEDEQESPQEYSEDDFRTGGGSTFDTPGDNGPEKWDGIFQ